MSKAPVTPEVTKANRIPDSDPAPAVAPASAPDASAEKAPEVPDRIKAEMEAGKKTLADIGERHKAAKPEDKAGKDKDKDDDEDED